MKKLIILLIVLLMMVGCTPKKPDEPVVDPTNKVIECKIDKHEKSEANLEYFNKLKDFKVREKNKDNKEDNKEFDEFLNRVFKNIIETSYLYLHSSVVDYKSLGLEKPEPEWGEIKYNDPDNEESLSELNELLSFDYDSLSYQQQYDYDLLEYSLYETLANYEFENYSFLYGSDVDVISSISSNLSDFVFHDKEEVEDYLLLVDDTKRYLNDIKKFTEDQMKDNIYMSNAMADNSIELLSRLLSKEEDNTLITTFDNRIDNLDFLSVDEKEEYKERNKKIVLDDIIPTLKDTKTFLEEISDDLEDASCLTLYNIDKNYAELTYILNGSYNLPIDEIYQRTYDGYMEILDAYVAGYYKDAFNEVNKIKNNPQGVFAYDNARDILDYLANNLNSYYPSIGNVDYEIDEMDASSAANSTVAYYWPAPLDNLNQNIIKTNPNNLKKDPASTYTTLAHEGFPGHLYQHVYYQKTNPHKFRNTQSFIGYTEGYAVRAQEDALYFGNFAENIADETLDVMVFDSIFYFAGYSLLDIGINYYGWSEDELAEVLEETLLFDKSAAPEVIEFLTDMPGVYCSYGLGYTYLTNFRDEAKKALGDKFDIVEFNKVILDCGPSPFALVKYKVDEYIAEHK